MSRYMMVSRILSSAGGLIDSQKSNRRSALTACVIHGSLDCEVPVLRLSKLGTAVVLRGESSEYVPEL